MDRIVADIESEKGTRSRANSDILSEIRVIKLDQRKADKILYGAMGGLAVLQFVLSLWLKS